MKRLFVLLATAAAIFGATAQEAEFTADRPGASTGPNVVGHKVIQLEQGIQYDGDGGRGQFTFSNTLLRYGLFDCAELRLGGDAFIYPNGNKKWSAAFSGLTLEQKSPALRVVEQSLPHRLWRSSRSQKLAQKVLLLSTLPHLSTYSLITQ